MNKIYLLGDIHGRDFWKELKDNTEDLIIFVGDYVDPYCGYEDITKEQAFENFKEIIEFARSRDNVILLMGNHDATYFLSDLVCQCRTDYDRFPQITSLFRDNADLFKLAYYFEYNNEKFLVTHAGVHKNWIEYFTFKVNIDGTDMTSRDEKSDLNISDPKAIADFLNAEFKKVQEEGYPRRSKFISALAEVSYYRGGWSSYGSCIWADVHEWEGVEVFHEEALDCYQIFGHTRLEKGYPLIGKNIACIDAREAYTLDYILEKRKENIEKNESKSNN